VTNGTNGRSLAGVVAELKDEVKEFATTRIEMFKSEMKDKVSSLKFAAVLIVIGALLGVTAWFVLTAALIAIIATAFHPSVYAYFFASLIVGVAYLIIGGIIAGMAVSELKRRGLVPERTIRVLKQDQVWLQTEARQQL
jgi:hypothetical protein